MCYDGVLGVILELIKHSIRSTYNLPIKGGRVMVRFLRPCHIWPSVCSFSMLLLLYVYQLYQFSLLEWFYNAWSCKCVVAGGITTIASLFMVFSAVLLIINTPQIKINPEYVAPCSPMHKVLEIPAPSSGPLNSITDFIVEPDFTHQSVERGVNEKVTVYCAGIEANRLNNHQLVDRSVPFNNTNQTLARTAAFLPLMYYKAMEYFVLKHSPFSLFLCLSNSERMLRLPSVMFLLYKRVDKDGWSLERNILIASRNVTFNSSLCANTTILSPESAVVYMALSTPDTVHFKNIIGYVEQLYYNADALDIKNTSNIVEANEPKVIPGVNSEKLVCYVSGMDNEDLCQLYQFLSSHVPLVWTKVLYPIFITLCILLCVVVCVCSFVTHRSRHAHPTGYKRV